jgi:hypothetical protein
MRLAATALAALALAPVASGLSEPGYIKAATKICAQRAAKIERLPHIALRTAPAARLASHLRRLIPLYSGGTRQLRALKAPRSFSYLVPRWLRYEQRRILAWKHALTSARRGNASAARHYIGTSNVLGLRAAEISSGLEIEGCE